MQLVQTNPENTDLEVWKNQFFLYNAHLNNKTSLMFSHCHTYHNNDYYEALQL